MWSKSIEVFNPYEETLKILHEMEADENRKSQKLFGKGGLFHEFCTYLSNHKILRGRAGM